MNAVVLFNPNSGRGRAAKAAAAAGGALRGVGLRVQDVPIGEGLSERLDSALARASLLVVVGGDGTVHHTLEVAASVRVPLYHYPTGTENLFAREFGMKAHPACLLQAVRAWRVRGVDLGELTVQGQQRLFALMCSVGPDASVIRRLSAVRSGPISHLSYTGPILAEALRPWLPLLTVRVDGREVARGVRGMAVVANSRQYAVRIDPAPGALVDDGLLDVTVFEASHGVGAGLHLLRSRLRLGEAVRRAGKTVELEAEGGEPCFQVDGECGECGPGTLRMTFGVRERVLRVLVPPQG